MGTRIKDFQSRKNIQQLFVATGVIGAAYQNQGENYFQVVTEGVGGGNSIQPQGRLFGQSAWTSVGSAIVGLSTGIGTKGDVRGFDEVRFNCTAYAASGTPKLIASGFWD